MQTLYQLKSNRFQFWNRAAQNRSCPHPERTRGEYAAASHVFWTCSAAKRHWHHLLSERSNIDAVDGEDTNIWVFRLGLPERPQGAWDAVRQTLTESEKIPAVWAALLPAENELWRFSVATFLHAIWAERLQRMEDPTLSEETHRALAQVVLRQALTRFRGSIYQPGGDENGQALVRVRSVPADALLRHVDSPLLRPPGSRGSPGPGGSGSVTVRLHVSTHSAQVVWVASMEYGSAKTTNNIAEYTGLVHRLRQAKENGYPPLHAVGGRTMALSQLRMHHTPKKPHLAALYREARALADDIAVLSWAHLYREFNRTADRAANIAMDTRTSIQVHAPTQRDIVRSLEERMDQDANHWLETSLAAETAKRAGPKMTAQEHATATRQLERRRTAVSGIV